MTDTQIEERHKDKAANDLIASGIIKLDAETDENGDIEQTASDFSHRQREPSRPDNTEQCADNAEQSSYVEDEYIKELCEAVSDPYQLDIDEKILHNACRHAGEFAHGIVAVEVFSFDNERLIPVGWWHSPELTSGNLVEDGVQLEDGERACQPESVISGVDLVGTLWSSHQRSNEVTKASVFRSLINKPNDLPGPLVRQPRGAPPRPLQLSSRRRLVWRDLRSIIQDPDTEHGPRLEALNKAGIEYATGVVYDTHGDRGIVVYYAEKGVDPKLLTSVTNEAYLRRTASFIGSTVATAVARRANAEFLLLYESSERLGREIDGDKEEPASKGERQKRVDQCRERFRKRVVAWFNKCLGGESQVPRGMSWRESAFSFFGSFVGIAIILSLNLGFTLASQYQYYLVIGPFGALMMLQYGLTAAPAAQPRNIIVGTIIAGTISLALTYVPESILPVWLRLALATALAIGAMVKVGAPHPPAAAHCLIYAEGNHNWAFFGIALLCDMISLIPAVAINNANPRRQYPTTSWGLIPNGIYEKARTCAKACRDKTTDTLDTRNHGNDSMAP